MSAEKSVKESIQTSVEIEMPQLASDGEGEGEDATLASWLIEVGDHVEAGDVVAELETDKATVELEAPATGRVLELIVAAGTEHVAVGTVLARIESDPAASGDAQAAPKPSSAPAADSPSPSSSDADAKATVKAKADARDSAPPAAGTRGATPLARRAAAEHGLDLEGLSGTGSGGRIVEADVLQLAAGAAGTGSAGTVPAVGEPARVDVDVLDVSAAPPSAGAAVGHAEGEFEAVRLSAMRRTVARRMTESKQQVPHFYLRMRVPMDSLMAVREELNRGLAESGQTTKISLSDFIVKAAAVALHDVPEANVQFAGDEMHVLKTISISVATPGGLVTPVVRDAHRKGLVALADETKALAIRAREGKLAPAEYRGGSLTVSNLGMYGIETVYPILNPPQACILGVGAALEEPVVRGGEVAVGRVAALTLAADNRAIDGAVGARWLAALRDRLEDPLGMVM